MGYFILVIAQTVAFPIICGIIELATVGGDPVLVFGKWWAFWGVGTRLLVAGIVQVSGKGPTATILGAAAPSVQEKQLARELAWQMWAWVWPGFSPSCPVGHFPRDLREASSC
jgi:hypothetical protein